MSEEVLDAIDARDVDRLADLLAGGADPNSPITPGYGSTPLQIAVWKLRALSEHEPGGPIDAVVLLLRYGARVNSWDDGHRTTALLDAVMIPHFEAVRILLAAGADPNVCGEEGDSPLRFCAAHGHLAMARLLLHSGADKTIHEAGGPAGMNALGFAATRLNLDMVRLLLAHGANPWVEDNDRLYVFDRLGFISLPEDPLAHERFRQISQLLKDVKPKVPALSAPDGERSNGHRADARFLGTSTPEALLDAIDAGDVDRLARLLAAGAGPDAPFTSRHGLTPLQVAVGKLEAQSEREPGGRIEAVVLLLRHGASVNAWDEGHRTTALLEAVKINHLEAARILLALRADPNVCGDEGASPLRVCAQNGHLEMARLLKLIV